MGWEGGGGYGEQFVRRIPEHLFPQIIFICRKRVKGFEIYSKLSICFLNLILHAFLNKGVTSHP
jgi:hypothetical protein